MPEKSGFRTGSGTGWPPTFRGGLRPVIAFIVAFSIWVVISNTVHARLFGPEPPVVAEQLFGIASTTVQFGIAVAILRWEGVRLSDLGLSTRLVVPTLVAITGLLVALNAVVAGLVVLRGNELSVGLFALHRSPPHDFSLTAVVLSGVHYYLFVGPAEELAFRGYLQNKVGTLLGSNDDRLRTALAVVTAGVAFAMAHVPTILILGGAQLQGVVGTLVILSLTGIAFGTVYELTRNLYLVAFLHGFGDWWPILVETESVAWPNWGVVFVCYVLLVLLYRRWATGTSRPTLGVAS